MSLLSARVACSLLALRFLLFETTPVPSRRKEGLADRSHGALEAYVEGSSPSSAWCSAEGKRWPAHFSRRRAP